VKTKLQVSTAEYRKLSDEELIHRFAFRQDKLAASYLFDRYGHLIFGICLKYFKDTESAKELTQQIFIKLLDDLPRFKIENFKAWLAQVTRNQCLMALRKKNAEIATDFLQFADVENERDVHHKIEEEYLFQYLDQALATLNTEQRSCIELFYFQKKTYAEISAIMHFTIKEVKSFLQNGKRNLKIKMEALAHKAKR